MSDYIDRDLALSHPYANGKYDKVHANIAFITGFESYKEWLETLPKADVRENRWIPVSERLPEEREWYLAVFKEIDTGYQLIPRVADYIGNGENKWRIIDEDGLGQEYRSILECVAWMPLPEPYKAESEDKE